MICPQCESHNIHRGLMGTWKCLDCGFIKDFQSKLDNDFSDIFSLDLSRLSGAYESGVDLFLTGSFGGFGGSFHSVHKTLDDASKYLKRINSKSGCSIFKIKIEDTRIYIDAEGKEHKL